MRYQLTEPRLAPGSTEGAFRECVQHAAQVALEIPTLTASERQLLHDLRRNEGRYAFRALDALLDMLTRVADERDALAFCDELRAAIVARRKRNVARDLRAALVAETVAEADANPAQLRVAMGDRVDAIALGEAIAKSERQRSTLDELLSAMRATRFALLHGGAR